MGNGVWDALVSQGLWGLLVSLAGNVYQARQAGINRADRLARDVSDEKRAERRFEQYQAIIATLQAISSGQAVLTRLMDEMKKLAESRDERIDELIKAIDRLARRAAK